MAQIAKERLDEPENPELTIDCALWEYKWLDYNKLLVPGKNKLKVLKSFIYA